MCEVFQSHLWILMVHLKNSFGPQRTSKATLNLLFTSDTETKQVCFFESSKQPLVASITDFLIAFSTQLISCPVFCYNISYTFRLSFIYVDLYIDTKSCRRSCRFLINGFFLFASSPDNKQKKSSETRVKIISHQSEDNNVWKWLQWDAGVWSFLHVYVKLAKIISLGFKEYVEIDETTLCSFFHKSFPLKRRQTCHRVQ